MGRAKVGSGLVFPCTHHRSINMRGFGEKIEVPSEPSLHRDALRAKIITTIETY